MIAEKTAKNFWGLLFCSTLVKAIGDLKLPSTTVLLPGE